jgi:plastocyanin
MKRSRLLLAIVGTVLFAVGLVFQVIGGTSDGLGVPRSVSLLALLAGLASLAIAGVLRLKERKRSPAAAGDLPPQDRRERRRAIFVRFVVCGLLLFPASVAIAGASGNAPYVISFFPPSLLAALVAIVVLLTGRFLVPALVIAIPMFLLFGMLSVGEFSHPESFADFVPAFWRFVGLGVAVVGAFVAMLQRRTGTLRPATPRERLAVRLGVLALIAVSAGSFVLDRTSRTTIARADGAIVVNTLEDSFDPDDIDVEIGRQRFLIRNDDSYAHTFTIDEVELDQYVAPRSDRLITVTFGRTGTYELYCAVTGHEDMTGDIEVGQSSAR